MAEQQKQKFTEKYAELWKFIKFTLVGFSSTLVELAVFYLLQYVVFKNIAHAPMPDNGFFNFLASIGLAEGLGIFYSYVISTTIGYIIAFILNRKTTFKADSNVVLSTILYIIMVVFTIIATAWIGTKFQNFMVAKGLKSLGDIITKPLVATLATAWTYPLNRFVIHRHKKPVEGEEAEAAEATEATEVAEVAEAATEAAEPAKAVETAEAADTTEK
ncbi:MAG: GtrA family protein [Clostridia bacterium]|nr:GtrA family protein [Clostridia bacterium]